MKTKTFQEMKDYFNQKSSISPKRSYIYIKKSLENRRCWKDGLTTEQLVKIVNDGFRKARCKRRIGKQTIYDAISKINLFYEPPFYIKSDCGQIAPKKWEFRYFVPVQDDDVQKEIRKLRGIMELKYRREGNLRSFNEKEIIIEEKQKAIRKELEVSQ